MNSPHNKKPWAHLLEDARNEPPPPVDLRRAVRERLEQRDPSLQETIIAFFGGAHGRWLAGAGLATMAAMLLIGVATGLPQPAIDPDQAFLEYLDSGEVESLW